MTDYINGGIDIYMVSGDFDLIFHICSFNFIIKELVPAAHLTQYLFT